MMKTLSQGALSNLRSCWKFSLRPPDLTHTTNLSQPVGLPVPPLPLDSAPARA